MSFSDAGRKTIKWVAKPAKKKKKKASPIKKKLIGAAKNAAIRGEIVGV